MRGHVRSVIIAVVMLGGALPPALAGPGAEIEPREMDEVFEKINAYSNAQDLQSVEGLLWEDARLVIVARGEAMEFSVPEYMNILKDSWQQTSHYTYEYKKEDCHLNGPRARCLGTVRETMVLENGQFLTSAVSSEDIFEKRDGSVRIVYSKANTDEAIIGSRPSPNVPLAILNNQGLQLDGQPAN
jgi:hypothetical protein